MPGSWQLNEDLIRVAMSELTRPPAGETDLDKTLAAVTSTAVKLIDGVDCADVMVLDNGKVESLAPTHPLAGELDAAQIRLQQGPCLQAALAQDVVHCPDLAGDDRWPQFAAVALDAGVNSMLSFRLYSHSTGSGALNLFGYTTGPFNAEDLLVGAMLATHAANALLAINKQRQFESALASRDIIGQAKGMLMERFEVSAVRAFEMMTTLSQDTNTPLRVVAHRITEAR